MRIPMCVCVCMGYYLPTSMRMKYCVYFPRGLIGRSPRFAISDDP